METDDTNYIYRNELDKACFEHNMTYGKYKNLERRTQSDKALKDKTFEIASNPKNDGYQRGLASMVYKFFDKKSKGNGIKFMPNQQLENDFHKSIIRKFKKRRVCSSFRDKTWAVDLADIQLISKYNKRIRYLLCVIDLFSKYGCVVPLKNKIGVIITKVFQKNLDNSKRKPNKIWNDQGIESYYKSFKNMLQDNDVKMYSTFIEGKSVVAERFIKTFKNKIYKHMTAISKNVSFDILDDIVDEYNNTYHRTIKTKPIDVKSDSGFQSMKTFLLKDILLIGMRKFLLLTELGIQSHGLMLLVI